MKVLESKEALRNRMRKMRDSQDPMQKKKHDQRICKQLISLLDTHLPKSVHCYLPMGSEVDITPVIEKLLAQNITVVCPRSLPRRKMDNLVLKSTHQLEDGIFGTRHPAEGKRFDGVYDVVIVPGLAFDRHGNRLGYGAGYYDTFLEQHPNALKIGVGYPFQVVDELAVQAHDIPLDKIISGG